MKNTFKKIFAKKNDPLSSDEKLELIEKSSKLVGPGVFYSTIIVIASFLPVFLLTGMEGKLFSPLAWTKSFILIVDAFLAITLTPVLISYLLKGRLRPENKNPINRKLEKIYTPILTYCLKWRKTVLAINIVALLIGVLMFTRLGSEFMPPLDEGSILFMPVTLPDVSNSEVKRILQVQDKIIKSIPEVEHVLGKAGRANTATDNSPISMIETIILLKPQSEWRSDLSKEDIINEINNKLQIVNLRLKPTNNMTPKTTSKITMKTEIDNAKGSRKGKFKTGSEKYSSNLKANPIGSFSLINPEMMNKIPTKIRENWVMMFFMFVVVFN